MKQTKPSAGIPEVIGQIMSSAVRTVTAACSLQEAAALMAESGISSLVIEEEGRSAGIITESDLVRALHSRLAVTAPVSSIMSTPVICAPEHMDILEARCLIATRKIRHLVVIGADEQLTGVVSETDFRRHFGSDVFRYIRTLENVMDREVPQLAPEQSLMRAISRMVKSHSDYVLVVADRRPIGILTERDIPYLLARYPQLDAITLSEVMSAPLHTIISTASITTALDQMGEHRVRHMVVVDSEGEALGVVSQHRLFESLANNQIGDILAQVSQDRDRLRLEMHLQLALDAAGAGNWEYNHPAGRLLLGDSLCHLLGYDRHTAPRSLGEWQANIHPEDLPVFLAIIQEGKMRRRDLCRLEYRMRHVDGHWLWVEDRSRVAERATDQTPLLTVGIVTDVSARRAERETLDNERRRLTTLLQTLPDMVWLKDPDGVYLDINNLAARLFGLKPHEVIGRSDHDFLPAHVADALRRVDCQVAESGQPYTFEEALHFPDGHVELHETTKAPVYRQDGQLIGVLGIAHDITQRRAAAEALQRQNHSLQLMNGIARAINHGDDDEGMLAEICVLVVEVGQYAAAQVVAIDPERPGYLRSAGESARNGRRLPQGDDCWRDGNGPAARAIRQSFPLVHQHIADEAPSSWRDSALAIGYTACLAVPLRDKTRVIGALVVYADQDGGFGEEEISLLEFLAGEISVGLDMHRSRRALADREMALLQAQRVARLGHYRFHAASNTWESSQVLDEIFGIDRFYTHSLQGWLDLVHPEDRERMERHLTSEVFEQGKDFFARYRIQRRNDGCIRWVEGTGQLRRQVDGSVDEMFGTIQDVTERHLAEEELNKLSLAIEQSPHSIVITNTEAKIEYVNAAFINNTGYSREEAIGQNPKLLQSGETPATTFGTLWQTLAEGQVWRGEFANRRKDGSIYYEFAIISPVRQPDGRITHYLAIKEDITEKKRNAAELDRYRHELETVIAERTLELTRAKEQAEAASRAKSAFVANMSHEIRTPMNAIIGLTHLAQRDTSNPEQRERLSKVADAAQHLLSIINDVLDISKIEAGKLLLEKTEFSLPHVLDTARSLIGERAESKNLPVNCQIDPKLPPILRGDPLRIQQILVNFLSNAVKFTDRGSITLSASLLHRSSMGIYVRFEVRDTGIGMSTDLLDRLFTPFEQADSSTTRRYGGTGLGLAISRRLAEAMGGAIGASSEEGNGSTFWFTALIEEVSAGTTPLPVARPRGEGETALVATRAGARILLAEDNEINQEVICNLLLAAGLAVDIATNGEEAVRLAGNTRYDLILMDMQMPVMDGIEATRRIRALKSDADVPILAITANAFEEDRQRCLAAGMNDHVAKPVNPEALFATILRWLPEGVQATAIPAAVPTESELRQRLDSIAGLDTVSGLRVVRGKLDTYMRLLGKFTAGHRLDFSLLRDCLAASNQEEAVRLAHSLKGAAGTLGAIAIQQAAAELEKALRERRPADEINRLTDITATLFNRLASDLPAISNENEARAAAPAQDIAHFLKQLRERLSVGDISAQEYATRHQSTLQYILGERWNVFNNLLSSFDFEAAQHLLDESVQRIGIAPAPSAN